MVEASRNGAWRSPAPWNGKVAIVVITACTYWTSVIGQLFWHMLGLLSRSEADVLGLADDDEGFLQSCITQVWYEHQIDRACGMAASPVAGLAMILSILSLWWNPLMKQKIQGIKGRMEGLGEYYSVQVVSLVVRGLAWAILKPGSAVPLDSNLDRGLHAFMLLFLIIVGIISVYSVRLNDAQLHLFSDISEPLIAGENTFVPPSNQVQRFQGSAEISNSHAESVSQPFPVEKLAPLSASVYHRSYNPPTPPPESEDPDAMDWTPSHQTFAPNRITLRNQPQQLHPQASSPFHGALPPAPVDPARRLRNPPQQPNIYKAPAKASSLRLSQSAPRSRQDPYTKKGAQTDDHVAPPKFFPRSNFDTDTGLESLFMKAFRIDSEPTEVQAAQASQQSTSKGSRTKTSLPPASDTKHTITFISLFASVLGWEAANSFSQHATHARLVALGVACMISALSFLEALTFRGEWIRMLDVPFSGAALLGGAWLVWCTAGPAAESETTVAATRTYLVIMMLQELMRGVQGMTIRHRHEGDSTLMPTKRGLQEYEPPNPFLKRDPRELQERSRGLPSMAHQGHTRESLPSAGFSSLALE